MGHTLNTAKGAVPQQAGFSQPPFRYFTAGEAVATGDLIIATSSDGMVDTMSKAVSTSAALRTGPIWVSANAMSSGDVRCIAVQRMVLTGVDTSGASAVGDPVYLDTTSGKWTVTAPTNVRVVGVVKVKSATVGVVELDPGAVFQGAAAGGPLSGTTLTLTGVAGFAAGTVGAPAISYAGDPDTGFYNASANVEALALGGVAALAVGSGSAPSFTAATDTAGADAYVVAPDAGGTATAARVGAALVLKGGKGSGSSTTVAAGVGGAITLQAGAGGAKTGIGAAVGGAGALATVAGGAGGFTAASSGAAAAGAGGGVAITGAAGGNATAGTGDGGAGGSITLTPGAGGTSAGGTAGAPGAIVLAGPVTQTVGGSTAAAGANSGNAGVLPAATGSVYPTTAADDTKGVRVNAADKVQGRTLLIGNGVSNKILNVYAPTGGTINGAAADAAFPSVSGKGVIIVCLSAAGNTWLAF